ncbi:MAG: rod shape-determining protein RodA [Nitrososphaerales archaeon]
MKATLTRRFDWSLLVLALVLSAFGIVMVASALSGNEIYKDYPWRQALFLGVGLVLMFVAAALDYRLLTTLAYPIYLFFLAALVVIKVIGTVAGGAQRWLTVGEFFLQPSELTKIALILALAHFLSSREEKMESIFTPILAFGMLVPAVALIFWQPNLGTALIVVAVGAIMIAVAGLRWRHAAFFGALAAAAGVFAWRYLLQDYMKDRILMLFNPSSAKPEDLYNVNQAMIGIGSGGWLGRGLFRGSQSQLHFLRVRHTDFIFTVTAEELGFIGAVALILLLTLLMLRLVHVANQARDTFGMLIVTGVTGMLFFQVLVNIGMNLSIMPVTGIPLPFISYGGSSLWTMLIAIGLVESVAIRHKKIGFDT